MWLAHSRSVWNTRYLDAALIQLRSDGATVKLEDMARLSPLSNAHIHLQGRYHFAMHDAAGRGQLRPFHIPD